MHKGLQFFAVIMPVKPTNFQASQVPQSLEPSTLSSKWLPTCQTMTLLNWRVKTIIDIMPSKRNNLRKTCPFWFYQDRYCLPGWNSLHNCCILSPQTLSLYRLDLISSCYLILTSSGFNYLLPKLTHTTEMAFLLST